MQNSSIKQPEVCGIINPASSTLIPLRDHGLSIVTASCSPRVTGITPDNTPVIPSTHTCLSIKQALVFEYLERVVSRQTNYNTIAAVFGLSKSAVRSAVSGLVTKKYIKDLVTVRNGVFQGFVYKVDGDKCQRFMAEGGTTNPIYIATNYTIIPPTHTECTVSDPMHTYSSLSSFEFPLEKDLTTKTIDLSDPEMLWWVNQGLTNKLVKSWQEEFKTNLESLVQSLRSARFDVVVNEIKPRGMPIENPLNWIYKILQKSGSYPRPKNYKSIIELRADELEDQLRRDSIAKAKIVESEFEVKFRKLMNDKESTLYIELLGTITDFARENPLALEIDMRESFRKRIGWESNP